MKILKNFKLLTSIFLLLGLLTLTHLPLAEAAVGTSYNVADMPGARSGHGQSTLKDGRILVTGGKDGANAYTSTSWIYNPGTNSWSAAASMLDNRYEHGQSTLPDGRVLVTGGYSADDRTTSTAWIYNPGTNSWSAVEGMPTNRVYHTQSTLQDGKVMVNGGYVGSGSWASSNAWIYDPVANTWTTKRSMPDQRAAHAQSTLNDGRVFVTLGEDGSIRKLTAWIYNVDGDNWSTVAAPPALRSFHAQSTLPDDRVLITGGIGEGGVRQNSVWTYNPILKTFNIETNLPQALMNHAQSPLADGRVLITGGRDSSNVVQAKAFFYSFNNQPVISLSTIINQRINATGTITLSGKVNDLDRNNVAITATIGGITKTKNISPAPATAPGSTNWTLTWSGSEVPEGSYKNILITANDGAGGKSTTTYNNSIIVEKTAPTATLELNNGQYLIIEPISNEWGPSVAYQVYANAGISGLNKLVLSNTANFDEPTEVLFGGADQLEGLWTTLNDFIVGREKTVFAQVYSNSGLYITVTDSVYRNVLPTIPAFNVEPKLAALYPTLNLNFHDNDSDLMSGGEVNIYKNDLSIDQHIPVSTAISAWSYDPNIYGPLTDGNYLAKIKVKDTPGSWSSWTDPVAFVMDRDVTGNVDIRPIDQPDPTIVLDASGESFTYTTNTVMENTIFIQDVNKNTVRTVPQGIQQPGTYTFAWDNKDDSGVIVQSGTYQVYLKSWDGVNEFNTLIATIQIDRDAPVITINQPGQYYFNAAVPINIASTDNMNLGTGTVKVINQAGTKMVSWATTEGNFSTNYTPPADGTYQIQVTQKDAANNQTYAARQFVYKTAGPSLTLIYPLTSNTDEATISITVNDVYLDMLYLDGLELPIGTIGPNLFRTAKTVTLTPGKNTFTIQALDFAGNISQEVVSISYQPPVRPSHGGDTGEPLSEAEIIKQELGLPLNTKIIDLRQLVIDPATEQPVTGQVEILAAETSAAKIEISGNSYDLANIDLTKALNYDQLQTVFSELEGRIDLEFSTFEDAVGSKAVVIGKDGSVNELQIELPFLTKYTLPEGSNPTEWGVFKFEPKTGRWSMIPSYYTSPNTLEARTGIGIYGVKKLAGINYTDVLPDSWVYPDLKIITNIRALPVIENNLFEPEKMITFNEALNMTKVIASSQKFSQMVETINAIGLRENHLTRTELVVMLNTILETELKVTLINRPGNVEYSKIVNFRLNNDPAKLDNFIDAYGINPLYKNDLAVAVNYGLIVGLPGYQLAPNDYVTRAEVVTMLKRYAYFAGNAKLKNLLSKKG